MSERNYDMKKVLIFVNSFNVGGVTNFVREIYRNLDRSEYKISFLRLNWNINDFDREIEKNGDRVYYIEDEKLNGIPVLNYKIKQRNMVKKICNAIGTDKFDTAYIHANAVYAIPAARKLGIKNIIMHVHEAVSDFGNNINNSKIMYLLQKNRQRVYNSVNYRVGVSKKACLAKFGIKAKEKFVIIHPPIDIERFNEKIYDKDKIAAEFEIDRKSFNMIHVGRLNRVKNQSFMIEILKEINKTQPAYLHIIGEGELKKQLVEMSEKIGVLDKIHFYPADTNPGIYTIMNCSLLPSFSEAFGMVAVESQLMNVPCFASDKVPEDVDIGLCEFLPLDYTARRWAEIIVGYDYENCNLDKKKAEKFKIDSIIKEVERIL